ncbi:MAG: S41 family peptidase [Actinobacteria bacterium HGW-Actinobacteria-1]|jgi:carboxyl-terminal processing protease|nr:MAG: S41 family peptidase [Actinobacteria bacterium HGW-Actinobacteria-1]
MNKALKYTIGVAVVLTLIIAAFAGGVLFDRMLPTVGVVPGVGEAPVSVERAATEVQKIINAEALEPSDEASMTAGVVKGMLESLGDPYATYFDAEHYKYFTEQTNGEFYGIGITIADKDGQAYVVKVLDKTPAAAAGLKADDVITSIDGVTRDKWDVDEVVKRVRGPEGTPVKLGITRAGSDKPIVFTIKRAKIEVPNIEQELVGKDVGYIRLYTFNQRSGDDVRAAIESLTKKGAKGFILDLRDNPGGLLSASVDVVSLFVKDGVVVTVDGRAAGTDETYRVSGDTATDAPLVLLVNENSASASEIVGGALQDYKRATIIGVTSFGKGSVQQIEELSFGGAVKLTIAHYLTPLGRVIDKKGVVPEISVTMDAEKQVDKAKDTQYQRALAEIRKKL